MHGVLWAQTGLYDQCWLWHYDTLTAEGCLSHVPILQVLWEVERCVCVPKSTLIAEVPSSTQAPFLQVKSRGV